MLRSLITILLLTGLAAAPISAQLTTDKFDETKLLNVSVIPAKRLNASQPVIQAKSAVLMDLDTGILLFKQNPYEKLPMASLTKIMTAVLILENHSLDEVVTVEENFNNMSDSQLGVRIWLSKYEKITVENLLTALLVRSAGDAAMALAEYHSGSVDAFVDEMNEKAKILNLKNTHFANPIGIDDDEHYSSAYELALLTKYALRNKDFRRIVQIQSATVTSTDGQIKHTFDSTNYNLNSYLDIRGVKTGTTEGAGESLINLAYSDSGREVIAVLLDSPERFSESRRMIDWAFRNFTW